MDSGDVATWVGSCFAAIAAGATLWTLKSQRDQIAEQRQFIGEQSATMALERAELHAAAEDRRGAQAKQIRMHHQKVGGSTDGQGVQVEDDHWDVTVSNYSDAPVHQLEVRFGTAYRAAEVYEWRPNWSLSMPVTRGDQLTLPVHLIGPGRSARFVSQRWSPATVHNNRPTLFFTDANGLRWTLDSHGKLDEALPEPGV